MRDTHQLVLSINSKLDVANERIQALASAVAQHEDSLYGRSNDGGLVADVRVMSVKLDNALEDINGLKGTRADASKTTSDLAVLVMKSSALEEKLVEQRRWLLAAAGLGLAYLASQILNLL